MDDVAFHIGVLPTSPIDEVARIAAAAEELGFAGVWVADSQSVFRDAYAALAICAERTRRIRLATGVTNPVTRHPAVIAGAMATLAEHSGGRAVLGIGAGESAVYTIGQRPAILARLEEVVGVVRALLDGQTALFDGHELRITWPTVPVPIYFASSGPQSLRLAGRISDGVLFQVGATPELVRYAMDAVTDGAAEAGREVQSVERLVRLACVVASSRDEARAQARGYVAAAAGTVFSSVPHEHLPSDLATDLRRMKEHYDYSKHASGDAKHADLLTDRIIDAIAIAGTPSDAIPRLRELIHTGAGGFVIPVATADPIASMRVLAHDVVAKL